MVQETDASNVLIDINTRIRVLEEKNNQLRERLLVTNQNMIEEYKRMIQEMRTITSDVKEMREDIENSREMIKHIIKESTNFARRDSVLVLEKYINMWNPMKFTTEEDVVKIIDFRKKFKNEVVV
ncbi:MAG: hypothetical protein PHF86_09200 [Candidatus Nanoarchaeia archaeon]|nr:hypothetical protein [Candidatus Nanoarchaeia archaeon]